MHHITPKDLARLTAVLIVAPERLGLDQLEDRYTKFLSDVAVATSHYLGTGAVAHVLPPTTERAGTWRVVIDETVRDDETFLAIQWADFVQGEEGYARMQAHVQVVLTSELIGAPPA